MSKSWLRSVLCLLVVGAVAGCQAPQAPVNPTQSSDMTAPLNSGSSPVSAAPTEAKYLKLSPSEVQSRKQAGENFVVVDVRASSAYATQHIEGAISMPLDQISTRASELPKDRYVLLYCTCPAEASAIAAADALQSQHGFSRLAVLVGGMNAWVTAGLPSVKPSPSSQP